jgi:hypothetical protein
MLLFGIYYYISCDYLTYYYVMRINWLLYTVYTMYFDTHSIFYSGFRLQMRISNPIEESHWFSALCVLLFGLVLNRVGSFCYCLLFRFSAKNKIIELSEYFRGHMVQLREKPSLNSQIHDLWTTINYSIESLTFIYNLEKKMAPI